MRTVLIHAGECEVRVKGQGLTIPCPLCHTRVRSGEKHHCRLRTTLDAVATTGGKATVEGLQPQKDAK
jgi:hypothetical protein